MPEIVRRTPMPAPPEELYAWHARPGAFLRLVPPWQAVEVLSWQGGEATRHLPPPQQAGDISEGTTVTLRARLGPLSTRMVARHTEHHPGSGFVDEMTRGPFRSWRHEHRFLPDPGGTGSILEDRVQYRLPLGLAGQAVAGRAVARVLDRLFAFRHDRTAADLARHARFRDRPRMVVAISGASGLVGTHLSAFLQTGGHRVRPLVRRPPRPGSDEIAWDPEAGSLDPAALAGVDAVVHLAGESIAGRWTPERRRRIHDSRVRGTATLARALAAMPAPRARVLVSVSAVGYYGDRGDAVLHEGASPGQGFLAEVCQAWEAAAEPARAAGVRVVHPRLGLVLSGHGGSLPLMAAPFRLGLGARLGDGSQWMSWIDLDDLVGLLHHLLMSEPAAGPFNAVAPQAVTNAEFTRTLAGVLHRPAVLAVPRPLIRAALGQMGQELLLASARVSAAHTVESGFSFRYPDLAEALRAELGG